MHHSIYSFNVQKFLGWSEWLDCVSLLSLLASRYIATIFIMKVVFWNFSHAIPLIWSCFRTHTIL